MPTNIQVSASILCADFIHLGDEIRKSEEAGVDMLHVDVMDGHFVPNITIGSFVIEAIRPYTRLIIDAHLMIENPGEYIESFAKAGADIISLQVECYGTLKEGCRLPGQFPKELAVFDAKHALADIRRVKSLGKKVHLVINPGTRFALNRCYGD